jgi:hypothetical protein
VVCAVLLPSYTAQCLWTETVFYHTTVRLQNDYFSIKRLNKSP